MIKSCLVACFALALSFHMPNSQPNCLSGKFVAFDKLQILTNPREPKQLFIVEVQKAGLFDKGQLLRLVYFAPGTSIRGGAKFLRDELAYANTWTLKVHKPSTENERIYCAEVDNFWRAADGSIDEDGKREQILRFRSTQFQADVRFENLKNMPCLILDSLER
jgi:hypothetical protein